MTNPGPTDDNPIVFLDPETVYPGNMTQATTTQPTLSPAPHRGPTGSNRWILAGILLVQALLYVPCITGEYRFNVFNRDDTASYLALGDSLAHGRGYSRSFDPENPQPHRLWPPTFPALIAATLHIHESLWGIHIIVAACAMVTTCLYWRLASKFLPGPAVAVTTLLLVCSPIFDRLALVAMTEHLVGACLLAILLLVLAWRDRSYKFTWHVAAIVLLIGAGTLLKGIFLMFVPAVWFTVLMDRAAGGRIVARMSRVTVVMAVSLIPWLLWLVRNHLTVADGYDGMTAVDMMLRNNNPDNDPVGVVGLMGFAIDNLKWFMGARILDTYAGLGWWLDHNVGWSMPGIVSVALVGAVLIVALWVLVRRPEVRVVSLALLFVPLPFVVKGAGGGSPRYWMAVHPMMLLLIGVAVAAIVTRLRSRPLSKVVVTIVTAAALVPAVTLLAHDRIVRQPQAGAVWQTYCKMAATVGRQTESDALIIAHNPLTFRWISGRHANPNNDDNDALRGEKPLTRPIYVLVVRPKAIEDGGRKHHREDTTTLGPNDVPGVPQTVALNDYYRFVRMRPSQPQP